MIPAWQIGPSDRARKDRIAREYGCLGLEMETEGVRRMARDMVHPEDMWAGLHAVPVLQEVGDIEAGHLHADSPALRQLIEDEIAGERRVGENLRSHLRERCHVLDVVEVLVGEEKGRREELPAPKKGGDSAGGVNHDGFTPRLDQEPVRLNLAPGEWSDRHPGNVGPSGGDVDDEDDRRPPAEVSGGFSW